MTKRLVDIEDEVLEQARAPVSCCPGCEPVRSGVCLVTELEVGWSARSPRDHAATPADLLAHLIPVPTPIRAEQRARELQALLVGRGQHRGVGVPDLLVAAIADVEDLTVLHYDADVDLVAQATGQATEWVVPRGSVD